MNRVFGKRANHGGATVLTLTLFAVLPFTAGIVVPLQAQTDPANVATPLISHNSWSKGAPIPKALKYAMTGMIAGRVVGGVTNTAVVTNNQVYNPVTNTWGSKAPLPVSTCDGASAVVKGILYVWKHRRNTRDQRRMGFQPHHQQVVR